MKHVRLLWLAGVVVAAGLVVVPGASAYDVSTQTWATASDLTIADYAEAPYANEDWTGSTGSDLFNMTGSGYDGSNVSEMEALLEHAAETAGEDPNPWAEAANVTINVVGTYLAYKARGVFFHWLSSEWGHASSGGSDGCFASPTDTTSNCELWRITAGTHLCIGYKPSTQAVVTWTAPTDGLLLVGDTSNLYTSAFSGPCYGYSSFNPVALPSSNTSEISAVSSSVGSTFKTDSGLTYTASNDFMIWWQPIAGTWAGGGQPAGFPLDNEAPYTNQPIPTGDLTKYVGTPTTTQIANALRQGLTDPSDTCGGGPCPWGDNGGWPGTLQTHVDSQNFDCALTGTCQSDSLLATFNMPDCYSLTFDACDQGMWQLGFTGTLESALGASPDVSIPAGNIVSTSPIAGTALSTTASTIATAYENPQGCTSQTGNPHWSDTDPIYTMLAKGVVTCDYNGTTIVSMEMWMCTDPPVGGDADALTAGAYGCEPVANTSPTELAVSAGVPAPPVYCPNGEPWVPQVPNYYIAETTLSNGDPSWSQDGWYWSGS